jgi:hypothetical protein
MDDEWRFSSLYQEDNNRDKAQEFWQSLTDEDHLHWT